MKNSSSSWERRIIFFVLLLAVTIPLIVPIGWKTDVSPHVKMVYDLVDRNPAGSITVISFDYDPATVTELQPMAYAIIEHAWKRDQALVAVALWPQGAQLADEAFQKAKEIYPDKQYGVDYVNLGYKTGGMITIQALGRSIDEIFPTDVQGTPISDIPMLSRFRSIRNAACIISLSAGDPGIKQWIMAAHDKHGIPVSGGTTAINAPGFLPYINQQNQLRGLLGGLKAASEYEGLLDVVGPATKKMDAQSIAHLLILVFVLLGNIKAWRIRRRKLKPDGD